MFNLQLNIQKLHTVGSGLVLSLKVEFIELLFEGKRGSIAIGSWGGWGGPSIWCGEFVEFP